MTSARILYPQFRDEQQDSKYPFADNATLKSTSGKVAIGGDTFIDASLFPIRSVGKLYISAVVVSAQNVTVTIGDANSAFLITASYGTFDPPADGVLPFTDAYGRPAGMLLANNLASFTTWDIGTYTFTAKATEFVSSVVIPANEPGVRGITDADTGRTLYGDIWLVGDQGVVLRKEGDNVIRVDIVGNPLFKRSLCNAPGSSAPAPRYLKTINNVPPDEFGNFTITATGTDTVLRIYQENDAIVISSVGRSVL